jgi:hypothetical protein
MFREGGGWSFSAAILSQEILKKVSNLNENQHLENKGD